MSHSVCFNTLQWCLLVNIFPPPPPWSRYCISLTLCFAPHIKSVLSALLRCHDISCHELAITLKLWQLNIPCFLVHFLDQRLREARLLAKTALVGCLLKSPWKVFFILYPVISIGSEICCSIKEQCKLENMKKES